MMRMRFLRAAVKVRRWKQQPKVAATLGRVRQGMPFAASFGFNVLLIVVLAIGYTSFVAKGIVNGGPGERVVTVSFFETIPSAEIKPEIAEEDAEDDVENAEIGAETLPEGNAVEQGDEVGEVEGEEAPDADAGEQTTVAKVGVEIPQVALPEIDAGEGRPDGIVGVDCYNVFAGERDKALECAGRDILSGWRAEIADLGTDWERFADQLGTENRQIRYGPLRASRQQVLQGFTGTGYEVPKEVQERYALEVARIERERRIREFGREDTGKKGKCAVEKSQDASTYDPVQPENTLGDPNAEC